MSMECTGFVEIPGRALDWRICSQRMASPRGTGVIRSFGLTDSLTLERLQAQGVAFGLKRLLLGSPSPTRLALLGYLTHHQMGGLTYLYERRGDSRALRGMVQVLPRLREREWEIAFLSPGVEYHEQAAEVWRELLTYLTICGARQGVRRIVARAAEDPEAEAVFRQSGYSLVSREEVFVLSQPPDPAPLPRGLHQVRSDSDWALREFYHQVTPQLARQISGIGIFRPRMEPSGPFSGSWNVQYVWAEKGRIIAHLTLCGSRRGAWLEVAVRPEHRAEALPYIRYMLTLVRRYTTAPIYCPVPDHSVGLGWILRTLGFASFTRQSLLVARTTVCVPVRRHVMAHSLEPRVDVGTLAGCPFTQVPAAGQADDAFVRYSQVIA
ncbi:MAG: hypothetical protein ACYC4R_01095 [Anaerolineae bacterium]